MPAQHNTERKLSRRDVYLKWICGYASEQGGRIYIGMDDREKEVGVHGYKKWLVNIFYRVQTVRAGLVEVWGRSIAKVHEACRTLCYPEPAFEVLREEMTGPFFASCLYQNASMFQTGTDSSRTCSTHAQAIQNNHAR